MVLHCSAARLAGPFRGALTKVPRDRVVPAAAAPASPLPTPKAEAAGVSEKKRPIKEFLSNIIKGAAIAAVAVTLLLGNVQPAEAARSAGRVGGFAGSSTSRSYGSGGGGGGRYSSGSGYRSNYGSSYVSPPSVYYGGGGISSHTFIAPPPVVVTPVTPYFGGPTVVTTAPAGSSALDALMLMALAFIAFSTVSTALAPGRTGGLLSRNDDEGSGALQLTKVQVGLLAVARDLKNDLDAIAEEADTSTSAGLRELLQQVVLALLRNPQFCAYASGGKKAVGDGRQLEREFNSASLAERSKFVEETLVNVRGGGGVRRNKMRAGAGAGHPEELIVVTLLVATRGTVSLPKRIDSTESLRAALRGLGALTGEQVLGVEVLWTPQAEGDSFSVDELTRDYPDMRSL